LAVVRDQLETLGRVNLEALQALTDGVIPRARNLPKEQARAKQVLAVFRQITGHSPDFKNKTDDLAWNTLMYRLRFPRNLAREKAGILKFRSLYKRAPTTPFDWASVRASGYVLTK
jgi:hypothetical protein